jgi:hypothetical protein
LLLRPTALAVVADRSAQVGGAAAAGALAAVRINADLVAEETAAAVAAGRALLVS